MQATGRYPLDWADCEKFVRWFNNGEITEITKRTKFISRIQPWNTSRTSLATFCRPHKESFSKFPNQFFFAFRNFFWTLKIETEKRLSQKIPNSPSILNPNEYGELVDKSLELQYEQDRFITLNYYFITFRVIYHFRTRLNMFVTNGACHPTYTRF